MSLSDKRQVVEDGWEELDEYFYFEKDVKESVRNLEVDLLVYVPEEDLHDLIIKHFGEKQK